MVFYVPMQTATRLATQLIDVVKTLNPGARLCFYGLYAPVNEAYLRARGVSDIFGGEFEAALAQLVDEMAPAGAASAGADAGDDVAEGAHGGNAQRMSRKMGARKAGSRKGTATQPPVGGKTERRRPAK